MWSHKTLMIASQNISVNDIEQVLSLIASAVPDVIKGQLVPDSLSINQKLCKQRAKPVTVIYQFSSVAQWFPTLCDPMNRSMPGLPVHHQILEFTQTHAH